MIHLSLIYAEDNDDDFIWVSGKLEAYQPPGYLIKYRITRTKSLVTTLHQIQTDVVDLILLDLNLLDSQNLETFDRVLSECNKSNRYIPIIVLTNLEDMDLALACMAKGGEYIAKEWIVKNPMLLHMYCLHYKEISKNRTDIEQLTQEKMGQLRKLIHRCPFCVSRVGRYTFRLESSNNWLSLDKYLAHYGISITDGICNDCYTKVMKE